MAMKVPSRTAPASEYSRAIDLLYGNPPFGPFGADAVDVGPDALELLSADSPEMEPTPEPALSGPDFIYAEFDRLRALPFAESSDGSETRPPVRARDVVLSARIRRRASHLSRCSGAHWPDQNRITLTADPTASRAKVSEVLLHELVHAATDAPVHVVTGRRLLHYHFYKLALIDAAKAAYNVELDPDAVRGACWRIDSAIVLALEEVGGEWKLPVGE